MSNRPRHLLIQILKEQDEAQAVLQARFHAAIQVYRVDQDRAVLLDRWRELMQARRELFSREASSC